jgi:hypothetical protein
MMHKQRLFSNDLQKLGYLILCVHVKKEVVSQIMKNDFTFTTT